MTTRAFTWRGMSLAVNLAAADDAGYVTVDVLNATTATTLGAAVVAGLDASACVPLAKDSLAAVTRWKAAAVAAVAGQVQQR